MASIGNARIKNGILSLIGKDRLAILITTNESKIKLIGKDIYFLLRSSGVLILLIFSLFIK